MPKHIFSLSWHQRRLYCQCQAGQWNEIKLTSSDFETADTLCDIRKSFRKPNIKNNIKAAASNSDNHASICCRQHSALTVSFFSFLCLQMDFTLLAASAPCAADANYDKPHSSFSSFPWSSPLFTSPLVKKKSMKNKIRESFTEVWNLNINLVSMGGGKWQ